MIIVIQSSPDDFWSLRVLGFFSTQKHTVLFTFSHIPTFSPPQSSWTCKCGTFSNYGWNVRRNNRDGNLWGNESIYTLRICYVGQITATPSFEYNWDVDLITPFFSRQNSDTRNWYTLNNFFFSPYNSLSQPRPFCPVSSYLFSYLSSSFYPTNS